MSYLMSLLIVHSVLINRQNCSAARIRSHKLLSAGMHGRYVTHVAGFPGNPNKANNLHRVLVTASGKQIANII